MTKAACRVVHVLLEKKNQQTKKHKNPACMDLDLSRDKIYDISVGGAFRVKLFIVCIVLHF